MLRNPTGSTLAIPESIVDRKHHIAHSAAKCNSETTYTYGYRYVKTESTDLLIVAIVVLFLVAVVVLEAVQNAIEL